MFNGDCIPIKDIKPGLKNINVIFIVLEVGVATVTKENREVRNFKVGDPTACINCSIWDEPGKMLAPGDIIRMVKAYASTWRHCLTLYSGKNGEVFKIGEFCMIFNEQVNMSEPIRPEPQSNVQALPGPQPVAVAQQQQQAGGAAGKVPATTVAAASTGPPAGKPNRGGRGSTTRGGNMKADRR